MSMETTNEDIEYPEPAVPGGRFPRQQQKLISCNAFPCRKQPHEEDQSNEEEDVVLGIAVPSKSLEGVAETQ